jgi:hypothetical protein
MAASTLPDTLLETVTYRCACEAEFEVRIIARKARKRFVDDVPQPVYPGLVDSLKRLMATGKPDELRVRLGKTKAERIVLSWIAGSSDVRVLDARLKTCGKLNITTGRYEESRPLAGLNAILNHADISLLSAIAEHGKAIKECAFCGRALKDHHSEIRGYGPKCAKRYRLDWP